MSCDASNVERMMLLRRPPVLELHPEPWVPEIVPLHSVDAVWDRLCSENDRYFDGSILHVLGASRNGCGGVTVHLARSSYRFYAVQQAGLDTGTRPLGVKGLCHTTDGAWLMGQRSKSVAYYPGCWEFVPGGSIPADDEPLVSAPNRVLAQELGEEAGLLLKSPAQCVALLYDPAAFSWELIYVLAIDATALREITNWEYDEVRCVRPGDEPEPLAAVARVMMRLRDKVHA